MLRTLLFWLGLVVLAAGVGTVLWDATRWAGESAFQISSLGDIWALLHRDSLLLLEPGLVRHVAPWTWEDVAFPLLQQPAILVLGVLGLLLMLLSRLFRQRI